VSYVIVNGRLVIKNGVPTGTLSGRVVRGRAWRGRTGGGCRRAAKDWKWSM
jgi:N-acyl-D-amino-acid deacylase